MSRQCCSNLHKAAVMALLLSAMAAEHLFEARTVAFTASILANGLWLFDPRIS